VKLSPLILRTYFVTELSVKANVAAAPEQIVDGRSNIGTKVETARSDDNPRLWKVSLRIDCNEAEGSFCPYYVKAELVGVFEVHPEVNESTIGDLVSSNGPAILYGAARELILLVTGRGPLPPFLLPSATFIDHAPSARKKALEQRAAPA
jgi:preprotein translocase subunit SecB